jgi:hypothetical protein
MTTIAKLSQLSMMNGDIVSKYDLVAIISIYNTNYFRVYRRYNNVFEFIIQDSRGEFYFHRDCSVRESLERMLCLTYDRMRMLYVIEAFSFKHNSAPPTMIDEIPDMYWSEIQEMWNAVAINLGGILQEVHQPQSAFLPAIASSSIHSHSVFNPPSEDNYHKRSFSQMSDDSVCEKCCDYDCYCEEYCEEYCE